MFQYLWMLIVAVPIVIWAIFSIKDIIDTFNKYGKFNLLDDSTKAFLAAVIILLFATSFFYFIYLHTY